MFETLTKKAKSAIGFILLYKTASRVVAFVVLCPTIVGLLSWELTGRTFWEATEDLVFFLNNPCHSETASPAASAAPSSTKSSAAPSSAESVPSSPRSTPKTPSPPKDEGVVAGGSSAELNREGECKSEPPKSNIFINCETGICKIEEKPGEEKFEVDFCRYCDEKTCWFTSGNTIQKISISGSRVVVAKDNANGGDFFPGLVLGIEIVGAERVNFEGDVEVNSIIIREVHKLGDKDPNVASEVRLLGVHAQQIKLDNVWVSENIVISSDACEGSDDADKCRKEISIEPSKHSVVTGCVILDNVRARHIECSGLKAKRLDLNDAVVKDEIGLRWLDVEMLNAKQLRVGGGVDLSRADVSNSIDLSSSKIAGVLKLSGVSLGVASPLNCSLNVARLKLEGTSVGEDLEMSGACFSDIDAKQLSVKGVVSFEKSIANKADFSQGQWVDFQASDADFCQLSLSRVIASSDSGLVDLKNARKHKCRGMKDEKNDPPLVVSWIRTGRLDLLGSEWGDVDGANLKVNTLSVSTFSKTRLNLSGAQIDNLAIVNGDGSDRNAKRENTDYTRITAAGTTFGKVVHSKPSGKEGEGEVYDLIKDLRWMNRCTNRNLYLAAAQTLKSQGRFREANRVELAGRWVTSESWVEGVGLLFQNGIGSVFVYFWEFVLVWLVGTIFVSQIKPPTEDPPKPPDPSPEDAALRGASGYVKSSLLLIAILKAVNTLIKVNSKETKELDPWLRVLSVMVKGEPWEHFEKKRTEEAVGLVILRLLGLLLMGLMAFSLLSVIPR